MTKKTQEAQIQPLDPREIKELYEQLPEGGEGIDKLDKWQKRVLDWEGSMGIRAGRQVGKSFIIGERKCPQLAIHHPGTTTLMIAAAQRQSSQLFQKTLKRLHQLHEAMLEKAGGWKPNPKYSQRKNQELRRDFELKYGLFKQTPTKTEVILNNGSVIYSLPTGRTGAYIRCYSVDFLIADEAAFIPEPVWVAVLPMLAVSRKLRGFGWEISISTPFGKGGHFYEIFTDEDYQTWHINAEDCPRIPKPWLQKMKTRLSAMEYAQEIRGEFVDEFNQFFPTKLIKKRMDFMEWNRAEMESKKWSWYLGVDIARYGRDENAFCIACMNQKTGYIKITGILTTKKKSLVDTAGRIKALDKVYRFKRVFIDSSGVGGGVYDMLVEDKKIKQKVVGLENARRMVDNDGRLNKLFKEDLYSNALVLLEKEPQAISIINNTKLLRSMRSMTFEYGESGNVRIFGKYSHLSEAFVRAVWCVKSKGLKLFIA